MRALGLALTLASSVALGQVQLPDGYLSSEGVNGATISPVCASTTQATGAGLGIADGAYFAIDGTACASTPTYYLRDASSGSNALVIKTGARINLNNGTDYIYDSGGTAIFNTGVTTVGSIASQAGAPQFNCQIAGACGLASAASQSVVIQPAGSTTATFDTSGNLTMTGAFESSSAGGAKLEGQAGASGPGVKVGNSNTLTSGDALEVFKDAFTTKIATVDFNGGFFSNSTAANQFNCTGAASCGLASAASQSVVIAPAGSTTGTFDTSGNLTMTGALETSSTTLPQIICTGASNCEMRGYNNSSTGGVGKSILFDGLNGGDGSGATAGGNAGTLATSNLWGTGGAGGSTGAAGQGGLIQWQGGVGGSCGSSTGVGGKGGGVSILGGVGGSCSVNGNTGGGGGDITITAGVAGAVSGGASAGVAGAVKIAGGSGAFVGTCVFSSSTTCTVTVPTGAKCSCTDTTTVASFKCAVSSTTLTCTQSGSNSDTMNCICL